MQDLDLQQYCLLDPGLLEDFAAVIGAGLHIVSYQSSDLQEETVGGRLLKSGFRGLGLGVQGLGLTFRA